MNIFEINKYKMLRFNSLGKFRSISHFVTLRNSNDLSNPYSQFNICDYSGDDINNIRKNRAVISEYLNIPDSNIIVPKQVHEDNIGYILSVKDIFKKIGRAHV